MKENSKMLNPDRIFNIGFGFFSAQVLITAVELNLFTILAKKPLNAQEIQLKLNLSQRGVFDFLDALVAMGLLQKTGLGSLAYYSNSEESALFLDAERPDYVGGIFTMSGKRLYRFWADLPEALKTGKPQSEVKTNGKPLFDELFTNRERLREFAFAMAGLSKHNFQAFTDQFPLQQFTTHVDLGASTGLLSKFIVNKNPRIHSIAFDLPEVSEVTKECVTQWGLQDKIEVVGGNFLSDPLPRGDLITLGLILHDWNLTDKLKILQAAYDALAPGGALVVIENLIDDERKENLFGLLMSLNMLIEFGDAFDYTFEDFIGWGRKIGFSQFEKMQVFGPCSAAIAWKR